MNGSIFGIFITEEESADVHEVEQVKAVAGFGLEGDRYYIKQKNKAPEQRKPESELTLVELESIDMLNREYDFGKIQPGELRRNLVTNGIRLNELVGRRFQVGEVIAEGLELCNPCKHLEKLTGKPIMKPLVNKAGLRACIINDGTIHKGDDILAI